MPTEAGARGGPATDRFKQAAFWCAYALVPSLAFSISLVVGFTLLLIVLAAISLIRTRQWRVLFNAFCVLAVVYLGMNIVSLLASQYMDASLNGVSKVLRHAALAFSVIYVVDTEEKVFKIFRCFLLVAFICAIDALLQGQLGADPIRGRAMTPYLYLTKYRLTGPFHHANDFSAYLSLVIMLFVGVLADGQRWLKGWRLGLCLLALATVCFSFVYTYSRAAWLAVFAACVVLSVLKRKKRILLVLALLCVWAVFFSPPAIKGRVHSLTNPKDGTMSERRELWSESIQMIREKPLIGRGVNTYARTVQSYKRVGTKTDIQYAHNGYLQMGAEIGLLGLASFLAVVIAFFVQTLPMFLRAPPTYLKAAGLSFVMGVFAFALHSAAETNLHSLLLVHLMWFAMAVAMAAANLVRQHEKL